MTQKPVGHEKGKGLGYGLSEIPMCEGRRLGRWCAGLLWPCGFVWCYGDVYNVCFTSVIGHLLLSNDIVTT